MSQDNLIEAIAEAIRQARRSYVKEFDLCSVTIMEEDRIKLEIIDEGGNKAIYHMEIWRDDDCCT